MLTYSPNSGSGAAGIKFQNLFATILHNNNQYAFVGAAFNVEKTLPPPCTPTLMLDTPVTNGVSHTHVWGAANSVIDLNTIDNNDPIDATRFSINPACACASCTWQVKSYQYKDNGSITLTPTLDEVVPLTNSVPNN